MPTATGDDLTIESVPRRNWVAITLATVLMMVSYFAYAAAFVDTEGNGRGFEPAVAAVGMAIAPFVFIVLGFVSRNPSAPKRILQAMGVLLTAGLAIGLIDPLLGAATGFCLGGALVLNPPAVERVVFWRIGAVVFLAVYMLVLLVVALPAGVFTGAVLPLVMIGFADEYAAWTANRSA